MDETTTTIMAGLSSLTQHDLNFVTQSIAADSLHRRRRLTMILSSQTLFSLTLNRLRRLSLHSLLASHLLSSLRHLTSSSDPHSLSSSLPTTKDLDAASLLLFICEARHMQKKKSPDSLDSMWRAPSDQWREPLYKVYIDDMLVSPPCTSLLLPYIEEAARCMRLVYAAADVAAEEVGPTSAATSATTYSNNLSVAAAVAAVVALPSVEADGIEGECVICKDEIREGREVCRVPCGHVFHWKCVIPWLKSNNTCPCCRFQLPTDDVFGEIRRLWDVLLRMAGGTLNGRSFSMK